MIDDQDLPIATFPPEATNDTLAAISDTDPAVGPAESVGASVNRVGQHMMDCIVNRRLPNETAPLIDRIMHCGQQNAFLSHPKMNLPDTLEFGEFPEYQPDGLAYSGICSTRCEHGLA